MIAFCKFRCMNNKIRIEKGRFHNIDRSLRSCTFCNTNQLGDEFHVLFYCTYFNTLRNTYIDRNFSIYSNIVKFKNLMNTDNKDFLLKLAIFCKKLNLLLIIHSLILLYNYIPLLSFPFRLLHISYSRNSFHILRYNLLCGYCMLHLKCCKYCNDVMFIFVLAFFGTCPDGPCFTNKLLKPFVTVVPPFERENTFN